jgi:hypothetical protein
VTVTQNRVDYSANICAAVNNHDFRHWNEALGNAFSSSADVQQDFLRLYRNGILYKQNNLNRWNQAPFGCFPDYLGCWMESTDWEQSACDQASGWKAVFGVRVRPAHSTGSGVAFTVSSAVVSMPTC